MTSGRPASALVLDPRYHATGVRSEEARGRTRLGSSPLEPGGSHGRRVLPLVGDVTDRAWVALGFSNARSRFHSLPSQC